MREPDNTHAWSNFLRQYSGSNLGRPIRLGTFHASSGIVDDNWIDCGSAFEGADVCLVDGQVLFQINAGAVTHSISSPIKLSVHFTATGDEDGFDVLDSSGDLTMLRFETHAAAAAAA